MHSEVAGKLGAALAAIAAALVLGGASAGAAPLPAIPDAMSAKSADLIVSPGRDAVVKDAPVRVVIRQPAGAKLTVRLNQRDVTDRFGTDGGNLVADLTSADGVERGRNHLYVLAQRSGGRSHTSSQSFHLVRRSDGLARLSLDADVPPEARLDIATGRAGHLAAARRPRKVRILLNGRRVERQATTKQGTRHEITLSAAHGLRFGVNKLRAIVVEPEHGRYAEVQRRFKVPRSAPLPNAGRDSHGHEGSHVLLGGKARAARAGDLRYRWEVVGKPEGSDPRLLRAGRAQPTLIPDAPGDYLVRQHVSERPGGGKSPRAAVGQSADEVGVTVTPPTNNLVEISADPTASETRGIKVGDTFYPHPGLGASFQWLTLDRATLQPALTANSWCCNPGDPEHSVDKLTEQLSCDNTNRTTGLGHLVIITLPPNQQVLPGDDDDQFNEALNALGVDSLPDALINDPEESEVVVGVPCGGAGSGWVKRRGGGDTGLSPVGWLMPDGLTPGNALQLRFQPERLLYDTSTARTENTNEMVINGAAAAGHVTPGEAGFHVVEVDPRNLHIVQNNSYATNSFSPGNAIQAMADAINGARQRGNYVAVQSIGNVKPDHFSWYEAGDALEAMGANPDTFNRIDGSYAFFGGPPLSRGEVQQSSSVNVVDPTTSPVVTEPGELRGYARIGHDGYFVPAMPTGPEPAAGGLPDTIYDIVFAAPTPWPAYDQDAMQYVTKYLASGDFAVYGPDLRQAYADKPAQVWSNLKSDLSALEYPGDNTTCAESAGTQGKDPGFTRDDFCELTGQLRREFELLDNTQTLFGVYEKALDLSGGAQGADLQSIGTNIENAVKPSPDESIVSSVLFLLQSIADIGTEVAEGPAGIGLGSGFAASLFDLGTTAATYEGAPVSDTISDKVSELSSRIGANIKNSVSALDGIRAVAVSDYGKLQRLSAMYTSVKTVSADQYASTFTTGADAYFSSTLVPEAYEAWRLASGEDTVSCIPLGYDTFDQPFIDAPKSSWVKFIYDYDRTPPSDRTLVMVEKDGYAYEWAPGTITGPMFNPVSQGGYGIEQSTFFWTLGDPYDENCDID